MTPHPALRWLAAQLAVALLLPPPAGQRAVPALSLAPGAALARPAQMLREMQGLEAGLEQEMARALDPTRSTTGLEEPLRVLLVEDEEPLGRLWRLVLQSDGAEVDWVTNLAEAMARIRSGEPPHVIITDNDYPLEPGALSTPDTGLQLIDAVGTEFPTAMLSGRVGDVQAVLDEYVRKNALVTYLEKPFPISALSGIMTQLRQARDDRRRPAAGLEERREPAAPQDVELVPGETVALSPRADAAVRAVQFMFLDPVMIKVGGPLGRTFVLRLSGRTGHLTLEPIGLVQRILRTLPGRGPLRQRLFPSERETQYTFLKYGLGIRYTAEEEPDLAIVYYVIIEAVGAPVTIWVQAGLEERGGVVTKERVAAETITARFQNAVGRALGERRVNNPSEIGIILDARIPEGIPTLAEALRQRGVPVAVVVDRRAPTSLDRDPTIPTRVAFLKTLGIPVADSPEEAARQLGVAQPIYFSVEPKLPGVIMSYVQVVTADEVIQQLRDEPYRFLFDEDLKQLPEFILREASYLKEYGKYL